MHPGRRAGRPAREGTLARKAHDLFSLLQSRGRSGRRSGGGFLASLGSLFGGLLPQKRHRDPVRSRGHGITLNGPTIAGIVFACLGIGYLLGDAFPLRAGGKDLNATQRRAEVTAEVPGLLTEAVELTPSQECEKLGDRALGIWASGGAQARDGASRVARFLRTQGLQGRTYQVWSKEGTNAWFAVAYFAPEQETAVRQKLLGLEFPAEFGIETVKKEVAGWPRTVRIE